MEDSLLGGLRSGHQEAFEILLKTYGGRLLATSARILGSEAEAQDTTQEALISAWKSIDKFEGSSSLYTWLHRITVNAALARLRSPTLRHEVSISGEDQSIDLAFEGLPSAWSEPGPNLEKRVAMRRAIQKALGQIPGEFRTVLLLRDVEELSSREVSQQLGIPDATVRQRLHRARSAMAELLRPELCEGPELTCGGRLDLLMDYIDNVLAEDLQLPVQSHLDSCPDCQPLLHGYRMTIGLPRAVLELTEAAGSHSSWISSTVAKARTSE